MEIAKNFEEMIVLGHKISNEIPEKYNDDFFKTNIERFSSLVQDKNKLFNILYASIYCKEVYGTNMTEPAMFGFFKKTHEERLKYITWDSRFLYYAFLNKASENHYLDNKFEAYTLLKPFYKREAILLSCENDYEDFCDFVKRNPDIFVKPNNLELAEGTHYLNCGEGVNLKETFNNLLKEAADISSIAVKRKVDHKLILEELIVPSKFINELNPNDMSIVRVTTVLIKGKVHFFYPCLRLLFGNGIEQKGEDYSYDALIDSDTGEVITNGKSGLGNSDINPVTGKKICGIKLPEWEELKDMLIKATQLLPNTRYIGWDVTHTDKGWCIIEGNTNGEFFYQLCVGHGLKDEFEELIGFKVPSDFWKSPLLKKRNKNN